MFQYASESVVLALISRPFLDWLQDPKRILRSSLYTIFGSGRSGPAEFFYFAL